MTDLITASPTSTSQRCEGRIVARTALTPADRDAMFALLSRYFTGTTRQRFEQDLAEKDSALLLAEGGRLVGFTTLLQMRLVHDGEPVIAFFSGDTIVDRDSWGETELPRLWIRHVLSVTAGETAKVYWFLISSGYKTYRFLPVFFRKFYPTFERETPPALRRLMDRLGALKFPDEYDPAIGVVRFRESTPLADGVAQLSERRLKDPHVAFFGRVNPGHAAGEELVCLTELSAANLTPAGRRMLGIPR